MSMEPPFKHQTLILTRRRSLPFPPSSHSHLRRHANALLPLTKCYYKQYFFKVKSSTVSSAAKSIKLHLHFVLCFNVKAARLSPQNAAFCLQIGSQHQNSPVLFKHKILCHQVFQDPSQLLPFQIFSSFPTSTPAMFFIYPASCDAQAHTRAPLEDRRRRGGGAGRVAAHWRERDRPRGRRLGNASGRGHGLNSPARLVATSKRACPPQQQAQMRGGAEHVAVHQRDRSRSGGQRLGSNAGGRVHGGYTRVRARRYRALDAGGKAMDLLDEVKELRQHTVLVRRQDTRLLSRCIGLRALSAQCRFAARGSCACQWWGLGAEAVTVGRVSACPPNTPGIGPWALELSRAHWLSTRIHIVRKQEIVEAPLSNASTYGISYRHYLTMGVVREVDIDGERNGAGVAVGDLGLEILVGRLIGE
ncbi:hypothetical protein B0H13DRAFT_1873244 [Mycena leptocephala]|nr:hypothetical protein B0H13DRAFT_1873244 [Mycena leptocephala]